MDNLVRIVVSAYLNTSIKRVDAAFSCVYSLLCQTHENFEIYIHHDGPLNDRSIPDKFRQIDKRVIFIDNLEHKGDWNHHHRHPVSLMNPNHDWVVYTNEDNYYVPVFLERMISTALQQNTKMVYCDSIHSHINWGVLVTQPKQNEIDMGSFMAHIDLIKSTPWTNFDFGADGVYAEKLAAKTNPIKVPGVLFVHN